MMHTDREHGSGESEGLGSAEQAGEVSLPAKADARPPRLRSLDALRGFDTFWICGGSTLTKTLAVFTGWAWLEWFAGQMVHPVWIGFALWDLVFPLFIFLAGVAMPYSLGRRLEAGDSKLRVLSKVAIRVLLLFILGAIYNKAPAFKTLAETRLCSVLGFIGMSYGWAALIYVFTRPRMHAVWAVGILLAYWAALMWIPVPGHGAGVLTPEGCLTGYIDRELIPWKMNRATYDPVGLLVTFSGAAMVLLGAFTGWFLRDVKLSRLRKAGALLAAGIVAFGIAKLWGLTFPICKNMWSSSFIVYCAGWSLVLLSIFYFIIDVLGFWRWSFFFIVIGTNAITIYFGKEIVDFHKTANLLFGGLISKADKPLAAVLGALAYILVWWSVLLFLYRRKIFLRV